MSSGISLTSPDIITLDLSNYGSNWTGSSGIYSTSGITLTDTDPRVSISDGDIVMDGVSLKDTLQGIQERLSILSPKPELLDNFEALKQAYEHYKTLEALCMNAEKPDN